MRMQRIESMNAPARVGCVIGWPRTPKYSAVHLNCFVLLFVHTHGARCYRKRQSAGCSRSRTRIQVDIYGVFPSERDLMGWLLC